MTNRAPPATLGDWLASREPAPPPALSNRISGVLGDDVHRPVTEAGMLLVAAGVDLLQSVLHDGDRSRSTALDLLTADALVTLAFEAEGADPARLAGMDARARDAMLRISRLAAQGDEAE